MIRNNARIPGRHRCLILKPSRSTIQVHALKKIQLFDKNDKVNKEYDVELALFVNMNFSYQVE
jgi:hypothetical protein